MLAHEVVDGVVGVDRLAGVTPESLEDFPFHQATVDQGIVDVGDLQLAAARGLEARKDLEDAGRVEIDPGHGKLARRRRRLLHHFHDAAVAIEGGHPKVSQVLWILDFGEQDAPAPLLLTESLDGGPDRVLEDVVAEHHDHLVVLDKPLRQPERLRDSAGVLLVGIEQPVDPPLVPVPEQAQELTGVGAARDDHHLGDARGHQRLDGVGHHRPVEDRQQVLVRDAGQGVEPAPGPPGEDDAFHGR